MILHYLMDTIEDFQTRRIVQGTVVGNNDPLNKSRVKVSIKGITDKIKEEHLPWYPIIQSAINTGTKIPPIGSRVVLLYSDIYNCFILGSVACTTPE